MGWVSERRVPLLATAAALLPWLTLVLPIYSFPSGRFDDQSVSLLRALEYDSAGIFLLVPFVAIAVLAGVAWLRRPGRIWAVLAGVVVVATGLLLIPLGQGSIIWDGVDDQGRPTGGYEVLWPDWGLLVLGVSLALLVVAAVRVLRQQRTDRSAPSASGLEHGSDTMTG